MEVYVIANIKGGVGKSTIAVNLAIAKALEGKKTLLIDTDLQANSLSFVELRRQNGKDDITGFLLPKPVIHKQIEDFKNFDAIVVDTGAKDTQTFRSAIVTSYFYGKLIVPVLPSPYDVWTLEDTLKVAKEIYEQLKMGYGIEKEPLIVLNQLIRSNISEDTLQALEELKKEYRFKVLNSKLFQRVVYRKSLSEGKGVLEMNDPKAIKEFSEFVNELSFIT
jgi:chromosome partitioning protein